MISARSLGKAKTLATNAGIALLLLAADGFSGGPVSATGTAEVSSCWGSRRWRWRPP